MKTKSIFFLCSTALLTSTMAENKKVGTAEEAIGLYYSVIPLKKDKDSWLRYAPSTINDVPGYMMVDSGANSTFFNARFAKQAKVKLTKKGHVRGVGGEKSSTFKGKIKSVIIAGKIGLKAGEYTFVDLGENEKVKLDGEELIPSGQLGFNVLSQPDLNVDFGKNRLLFPKSGKNVSGGLWGILKQVGYQKIDLAKSKNACYVPVKIGDKEGYFLVDTASNQTVLYQKFAKGKNYPIVKQSGFVKGVGDKKIPINIVKVNDFSMPGKKIATPMLIIPNKKISVISQKPIMGILGIPVIDHTKMIINFKRAQIYFPKRKK
jgi:hypothetical protein